MKIVKTSKSRLRSTDFSDLPFGTIFSDHMLICHYRNGSWQDPDIQPYGPFLIHPSSQVLHYGQSIFEGMKAFKNADNDILFFRREKNFNRLNKSAVRMSIPVIPKDIFMNGLDRLLTLDSDWCLGEDGYSLYIRPFIFASSDSVKASSSKDFTFIVITSPTTTYYSGDVNLLFEEHYTRASKGGVGFAKAAGNYAATFYPTKLANSQGFQQVIWLDANEHKYIEECGTMNIFFRVGDKLITPEISDSILDGVTRDSVINIAKDLGIVVEERRIRVSDIVDAYKEGILKEVFGTGTAVSVSSINSLTFRSDNMILNIVKDSYALRLKERLQSIQRGQIKDVYGWTSKISL